MKPIASHSSSAAQPAQEPADKSVAKRATARAMIAPTPTELATLTLQLVQAEGCRVHVPNDKTQVADHWEYLAMKAYQLWSASQRVVARRGAPKPTVVERYMAEKRPLLAERGIVVPKVYPVSLQEFLKCCRCPGRTHSERLPKYRAWMRSQGLDDDISNFSTPAFDAVFVGRALEFTSWLQQQRSERARRARAGRQPKGARAKEASTPGNSQAPEQGS